MDRISTHYQQPSRYLSDMPSSHQHLAAWRKHFGLTQQELASKVGTEKSAISKLETGRNRLDYEWRERIAQALGGNTHANDLLQPPPAGLQKEAPQFGEAGGQLDMEETIRMVVRSLIEKFGRDAVMSATLDEVTGSRPEERDSQSPLQRRGTS